MSKNNFLIEVSNLFKQFHEANSAINVLQNIDLQISRGERLAIVGPSGSGKSTLLHLLGGLDFPTSGTINVLGKNWQKLSEKERCLWRNKTLGFVYQFHHLLPEFTALENTMLPLMLQSLSKAEISERAMHLLQRLGLDQRLHHRPHQLSGGERQRVAIARAMVANPHCILADEPTGNLDNATADIVLNLWDELNREHNMALIIVTHDLHMAKRMDRSLQLINGKLGEVKW